MKNGIILSLILSFSFSAKAADLSVMPLFDEDTVRTHLSIPFKIKNGDLRVDSIENVTFKDNTDCRSLIDFINKNSFLIKCTKEGPITLLITVKSGSATKGFSYGPITIKKISDSGSVNDGGGTAPDQEWVLGQTLYYKSEGSKKSCSDCHDNPAGIKGRVSTAAALKNSIVSSNTMKNESIWSIKALTDAELNALIKFIKSN